MCAKTQDWLMRSRLPFKDEMAELSAVIFKSNFFSQLSDNVLPVKYRVKNIHHVEDFAGR